VTIRVFESEHSDACKRRGEVDAIRQRSPAAAAYLDALVAMNMGRPLDDVVGMYQRHMARAVMAETGLSFAQLQARLIVPPARLRLFYSGLPSPMLSTVVQSRQSRTIPMCTGALGGGPNQHTPGRQVYCEGVKPHTNR